MSLPVKSNVSLDSTISDSTLTNEPSKLFPKSGPGQYSDKFIDINPETKTLTLKHYLLVKSTRHIHIPDILYITPASNVCCLNVKVQGLAASGIMWARDWSRCPMFGSGIKRSFVVKVKGDTFRAGFSVEHREEFLETLEYLQPGITTYKEVNESRSQSEGGLIE